MKDKIMIVDDEANMLEFLSNILAREYKVETASNGNSAKEKLKQGNFDMVIADLRMPIISGKELIEYVHRNIDPDIINIIITGHSEDWSPVDATDQHVFHYFNKGDFEPKDLKKVVKNGIELRKLRLKKKEQAKKLYQAYKELKKLDQLKTNFTIITSHELRTPITVISSYLELWKLGIFRGRVEKLEEILAIIENQVDYLVSLINDLTNIEVIDEGKLKLNLEEIQLKNLVKELIEELKIFTQIRKHTVTVDIPSHIFVIVDVPRIKQVLYNLVINAIKYMPDEGKIDIFARENNNINNIQISVRDNGIGIEKSEQEKIFNKFYEVKESMHHTSGIFEFMSSKLGLGLYISKSFVEQHGGKLWVESKGKGKGSIFHFTLPKKG